ncbi:MAG: glycosyltransferase [Leptolyngbyaceae cyanobacterium RM2_2_4]|nr:glycosyltransferase [Leptolyngbyaceae cyanobacterium SM1_4_3]NJN89265.1 glycosyltransferase [Leptolyngbyaceae cyanobacterium SL_5_14]NJO51689.1 glycosyltransferase [Leptolyngbyaceae cyanobacterium RM2_2_4]
MSQSSKPFVSVIIPVFNDNERLKICLNALAKQTYSGDAHEIIVVDNGSTQDVKSVTEQFSKVLLAYESRPGSYIARNKALSIAKGEVIAFTDADCIPEPDWIEKGVANLLSQPNVGLVAGRIDLFARNPNKPSPVELYESLEMSFPQDKFIEEKQFGATANLFTFKQVLDDVGFFDENLKSGGDLQWGQRVFARGYKQLYADDACIKHPTRDSWEDLRKRSLRIIGGKYDLMRKTGQSNLTAIKDLILFLKPPFRSFLRIWTDARLQGPKQKFQFTVVMLRLRYVGIQERLRLQLGGGISDRG